MFVSTALAATSLDIYFDNDTSGNSGSSVTLDRGYLNAYIGCQSTRVNTCRGSATLYIGKVKKKGKKRDKKVSKQSFEGSEGSAAGVSFKIPSKYAKKSFTAKVCAKESSTGAKDCSTVKVKKS